MIIVTFQECMILKNLFTQYTITTHLHNLCFQIFPCQLFYYLMPNALNSSSSFPSTSSCFLLHCVFGKSYRFEVFFAYYRNFKVSTNFMHLIWKKKYLFTMNNNLQPTFCIFKTLSEVLVATRWKEKGYGIYC